MKVQMVAGISGVRDGVDWPPVGGFLVVPDAEGADLVKAGLAREVKAERVVAPERAVAPKPENRKDK